MYVQYVYITAQRATSSYSPEIRVQPKRYTGRSSIPCASVRIVSCGYRHISWHMRRVCAHPLSLLPAASPDDLHAMRLTAKSCSVRLVRHGNRDLLNEEHA